MSAKRANSILGRELARKVKGRLVEEIGLLGGWTCHICGATRPDKSISVRKTDLSHEYGLPAGTMSQNVRYCNDRAECVELSKNKRLVGINHPSFPKEGRP